jgi:hypothetical protein
LAAFPIVAVSFKEVFSDGKVISPLFEINPGLSDVQVILLPKEDLEGKTKSVNTLQEHLKFPVQLQLSNLF